MKILVLSDIHANLTATNAVLADCAARYPDVEDVIILGDLVNYGPRPNETIGVLRQFIGGRRLLVALAGNHEMELFNETAAQRFSTGRGADALKTTATLLSEESRAFLRDGLSFGPQTITAGEARMLCVHASLGDPFWGKLDAEERARPVYATNDYVLSGHTHVPHLIEAFFPVDRPEMRNQKKVIFLNPGSVGQPRNHNPRSHYAVLDPLTGEIHMNRVPYDIEAEIAAYPDGFDEFYRIRLRVGV